MMCEKCHKNLATVRYAEVVDGQVKNLNLCSDCLEQHQETAAAGFKLANPRPVRLRQRTETRKKEADGFESAKCTICGHALIRLQQSNMAGCSGCFEMFSKEIEALLEELHAGVRHRGKTPHVDDERARARSGLQTKRALLRSALRTEDYEEAAHLRDEIHVLENELNPVEKEG